MQFPDRPVPILTPRILLRPPKPGDGQAIYEAVVESLAELRRFMPWAQEEPRVHLSEAFAFEAAESWAESSNTTLSLPLLMFDRTTHRFLGGTGFHNLNWKGGIAEIGYWLRTAATGRGYMYEAVIAQTYYAFHQLHLKQVVISCDVSNHLSMRIPEALGFRLAATQAAENSIASSLDMRFVRENTLGLPKSGVSW
ncbi:MAG: GNAT family N-acetyltransferase [Pseudomonadota bacterium]